MGSEAPPSNALARHCCDVFSKLCCPGAKPRRCVPPFVSITTSIIKIVLIACASISGPYSTTTSSACACQILFQLFSVPYFFMEEYGDMTCGKFPTSFARFVLLTETKITFCELTLKRFCLTALNPYISLKYRISRQSCQSGSGLGFEKLSGFNRAGRRSKVEISGGLR